ncbi:MAG: sulfatase [Candidatus Pedobacter colombiensis]|uniref:Sulfatase n=1 Tax=Candidatus Pedobacter colombiensis TaxID=3121371 RepID=A0AAJ5W536_9SPHI|nr:sulfatase [Pedobacter sp.]WEK17735.1 MAG: sulfatase [Pedobacter sp.]
MKFNNFKYIPAALMMVLTWASCSPKKTETRPNILILMSDNQSWNHAGVYGDKVVRTPNTDKIASEGVRFTNVFCNSPSCTPARGSILTGKDIWSLEEGANLWGTLPTTLTIYTDLMEQAGYKVGFNGKGWGPGSYEANGRPHNPAGNYFKTFKDFLKDRKGEEPWTFWISSYEPGRPYDPNNIQATGSGKAAGIDPDKVTVPKYLPDSKEVRGDIADYYAQVEKFDRIIGETMAQLKASGQLENTVVVVCADNGWQMPRGLANLYDFGTHVPLIISWPGKFKSNAVAENLVTLNDLAPTFLELANIKLPSDMTAKSLLPFVDEQTKPAKERDYVVYGRERHAFVRQHGTSYPGRAIRTKEFLYIRNYEPNRWPAGDPPLYGDVDPYMMHYPGPAKFYLMANKDNPKVKPLFDLAFAKRPADELFDVNKDPDELVNLAYKPEYAQIKQKLAEKLDAYLKATKDPRAVGGKIIWDNTPYFSEIDKTPRPSKEAQKQFKLDSVYNYLK